MDREPHHPLDTREFVALWNVAREEHLVQRLATVVRGLEQRGAFPALTGAQIEILAHALQLAAEPSAGPAAALQYMETLAGEPSGDTTR
jgi:hypothetical protein